MMVSNASTPVPKTPNISKEGAEPIPVDTKLKLHLKSPQVIFSTVTHARRTPNTRRGAWKGRKDVIDKKMADFVYKVASPSDLFSRAMLSFDLDARAGLDDDFVAENELFVKFRSDRRRSTGRGTLQTMINKRIALQTSGQVLAQRQEAGAAIPENKPVEVIVSPPPKRKKRLPKKPIEQYALEIPLAQELDEDVCVSQTQVYVRETTPLPFLSTPLHPIVEEEEERSVLRFLDLEASESESNSDDEQDECISNVSDLIADEWVPSENDFSFHARLHNEWEEEEDLRRKELPAEIQRVKRKPFLRELFVPPKKTNIKKKLIEHVPPPTNIVRPKAKECCSTKFIKKFPNRRSSVSSASSIEVLPLCTEGTFSFLRAPTERTEEAIPVAQGQRLMGTKRFAFGDQR